VSLPESGFTSVLAFPTGQLLGNRLSPLGPNFATLTSTSKRTSARNIPSLMKWSYFLKRLTAKGAEQLELDERRGCLFQAGWKWTKRSYKTSEPIHSFIKVLLSLKWLSNLSVGNRGFLPGLLADVSSGFGKRLSALALHAYKELVETSLLDWGRGKKLELYLLPSLWLVDWFFFLFKPGSTSTGDGDSFLKTVYSVESSYYNNNIESIPIRKEDFIIPGFPNLTTGTETLL